MEDILHQRGVLVIPDFVANAGGVISSYSEYRAHNPQRMFNLVEKKIKENVKKVVKRADKEKIKPRDAAMSIAIERVRKAMEKKKYKANGKNNFKKQQKILHLRGMQFRLFRQKNCCQMRRILQKAS